MFCNNCGKEIAENTKFCNHCGASQEAAPAPVQQVPVATPAPQTAPAKNNTLLIAIIAAVAVIVIAVVVVFALSGNNDDTPVTGSSVPANSSSVDSGSTPDSSNDAQSTVTDNKALSEIDGGSYLTGKVFVSDMGEYGKVTVAVRYNQANGVACEINGVFSVAQSHSEYNSLKSDFDGYETRIAAMNDSSVECAYAELSDSIDFVISFKNLNTADRAERVALAEEILDLVANQNDRAFYLSEVEALLTGTYGFTAQN